MQVLAAPHGTRGDVQPMIALALALRARGHDVTFVAPSNFAAWIGGYGFRFEPDGIDVEALLRSPATNLDSSRWQMRYFRTVLGPALFESVARASAGADLIVAAGVQLAAASVAEWRGVPCVSAAFCPCAVPGSAWPPPPVPLQTLPPFVNRLLWRWGTPLADAALRGVINDGRARLGLPPNHRPVTLLYASGIVVAADRDLAPLGGDAPAQAVQTDAWILDEAGAIEPRLGAFLDAGPAPVYIGFGSMVSSDRDRLASSVTEAVRRCGRRAIIAGGWAELDATFTSSQYILTIANAPHHVLLPRVAAVVHHGGAGTTTAAARAGVPQVILPHILDQYYWGARIERLGLGPPPLPVRRVTGAALTDRIALALQTPRFRDRAREIGARVGPRNGVDAGVDYLERIADRDRQS